MTNLTTFNLMGAHAFLSHYPLTAIGVQMDAPGRPDDVEDPGEYEKGDPKDGLATVNKRMRLLHFDISDHHNHATLTSPNCGQCVNFKLGSAYGGGRPVYYLPYNNNENHRTTLRSHQGLARKDFFMTALVDGCSIYVEGTAHHPSVYHLNAVGTKATGLDDTLSTDEVKRQHWLAKYARMDDRFKTDGHYAWRVQRGLRLIPARKLENKDYMITPGSDEEQTFEGSLGTLQTAGKAPLNVLGKSVDFMRLVTTQGSIFGVRGGGGAWRFFVQRRALVEYFHRSTTRKTRLFRSDKVTVDIESLGMQWVIRDVPEFWPGMGTGRLVT